MIERVALTLKALPIRDRQEPGGELDQLRLREAARAAIAAMREPTGAMKEAGFEHTGDPCWPENVGHAWSAMIDAALAEGK